ncbi:MAG TPA: zf-HC2 domain-containing protein [Egibacteraceae bacterium]|nr:zf-HC2 domain-containing protein [Egibacteraceae bacterium]
MGCREVGRLLQPFLDGEIDDPRVVDVADHLDACLGCGVEADAYRWLKAAIAGVARADDPRQLQRLQVFAEALATRGEA